ncbi:KGK domain-containing protein [Calothrix rhizosoleniae]|uniref:KGK domain-containing protein n=1 Tax=Calothrix rhizosoleniae TaxID=888997 RepID=UPI000B499592|nr:KGK domain-containing protein [Calothrix rhizosoleniae]
MLDNNFKKIDFEVKDKDSVISFPSPLMLKIDELMTALKHVISNTTLHSLQNSLKHRRLFTPNEKWLTTGIDCEILGTDGKGWKKGKVRIQVSLEFQSDEPEIETTPENTNSELSLDDIRRKLNQVN